MSSDRNKPDSYDSHNNKKNSPPEQSSATLTHLLSTDESKEYFQGLSKSTGIDFSIYDEHSTPYFTTNEKSICALIKPFKNSGIECPDSCERTISESLKLNIPLTYKCSLNIMNFSVPLTHMGEKAVIVGRDSFASYDDFLEFLRIAKELGFQDIPVATPLNFFDEDQMKNISRHIHKSITYLLNNIRERYRLTEKIKRLTAIIDTDILKELAKNRDSLYRYIIDTLEFILSPISVGVMELDRQTSTYKTVASTGKSRASLPDIELDSKNTLIHQLLTTKPPLEVKTKSLIKTGEDLDNRSLYLFPVFISGIIEVVIVVFESILPQEDIKIINALSEYIEITLENHTLRLAVDEKLDGILTSILDSSKSIAPLLNWERLIQTIIEKATHLMNAEQGSLMLLDQNTSELTVEAKKNSNDIINGNMKVRSGEGIAGKVFESGIPLLVEDLEKDPRINQKNKPRYKTKSFLSIPIKIKDRVSGVINISDKITGEVFNETDLKLIQSFTTNAAIAIERSLLHTKSEELKKLSITDHLTGLMNRRYMNSRLSSEIARFNRYKQTFSFLMVDIDGFKACNDSFGHITGDKVLKTLAAIITSSLRTLDIAARFGGDEFVIILPQTPKPDAVNIAKRLKEGVEKTPIYYQKELTFNITVSIGLTSYPDDASSITELLEKTDQALYLAKKGGKNKLVHL